MKIPKLVRIVFFLFFCLVFSPGTFAQQDCTPAPKQPEDSLVMNTVVTASGLVKTVKVEKEVFLCDRNTFVKDVNIFTEIIEDLSSGEPQIVEKKFEVGTCIKNVRNPRQIQCTTQEPEGLPPQLPPCQLGPQQPGHPLEMNTVAVGDMVKTVKTEKEVFQCTERPGVPPIIIDLNIFTEIIEDLGAGTTVKTFERAMCVKDVRGNVRGCGFF